MERLLILSACIMVASAASLPDEWQKPVPCKTYDCPLYDVIEKTENYEFRGYRPGQWVSTSMQSNSYPRWPEMGTMFMKLFRYISGSNANGEKIDMTVPVIVRVIPCSEDNCEKTFTMSFYISWDKQFSAPEPTGDDVFLESLPGFTAYVSKFSSWPWTGFQSYATKMEQLRQAVGDSNIDTELWVYAGYNKPTDVFNRHNEIWLFSKE